MIFIKILLVVIAWVFFFRILKSRHKMLAGTKATLITLLFASLIFSWAVDLYNYFARPQASVHKQTHTSVKSAPLKSTEDPSP